MKHFVGKYKGWVIYFEGCEEFTAGEPQWELVRGNRTIYFNGFDLCSVKRYIDRLENDLHSDCGGL